MFTNMALASWYLRFSSLQPGCQVRVPSLRSSTIGSCIPARALVISVHISPSTSLHTARAVQSKMNRMAETIAKLLAVHMDAFVNVTRVRRVVQAWLQLQRASHIWLEQVRAAHRDPMQRGVHPLRKE